jgi:hypothetical protein
MRFAFAALVAGMAYGCSKPASCEAVIRRIDELSPKGMWAKEPETTLLERCEKLKPETRRCIVDATGFGPMMDCYHLER